MAELCLACVAAEPYWSNTLGECTEITTQHHTGKQLSEVSPNTGRPADIELICWLTAFHLNAEEVVLAGTHRAIVKPPLGTNLIHQEKSVRSFAPPPTSSPLSSVQPANKLQGKNSKHSPCLLTPWRNTANLSREWAVIIYDLTSALKKCHLAWSEVTNRADADFTDYWMMRRSDLSAPLTADLQISERRCGKRNTMFTSTFCCNSCKFLISTD